MHTNKDNKDNKEPQQANTEPAAAEAGSNEWWEARLAAIAGGRESSHESNLETTTDYGITTATLEPG